MPRPDEDVTWSRWDEVDRLFGDALARPPAERSTFLEGRCGRDSTLLEAVRSLVRASDRAEADLSRPDRSLLRAALERACER